MSEPTTPVRIDALGMREDGHSVRISPEFADRIQNMDHDPEGYWEGAPGTVQYGTWGAGAGAVFALLWFQPRPGLRWLVLELELDDAQSSLRYVRMDTGTTTEFAVRRRVATGPGGQFLEHGRWLYHLNGLEQPIRWDGERVVPLGFATAPPAPVVLGPDQGFVKNDRAGILSYPATWSSGAGPRTSQRGVGEFPAGEDAPWRRGYAISYVNDQGQESPLSPLAWASGENPTGNPPGLYRLTARIAVGRAPDHVHAIRLWATRNVYGATGADIESAAQVYLHTEVLHGAGFDLVDLYSDDDLVTPYDHEGTGFVPVGASVGAFWQNRMWLAADGNLHYSAPGLHEQFPSRNVLPVAGVGAGEPVAVRAIPRGLLVWTAEATYIVKATGNALVPYVLEPLSESEGLAARNSVQMIPGVGLAWLAAGGPRIMTGLLEDDLPTAVRPLEGCRKTWRRQAGTSLATAFALHDPARSHVWWHIPEGGNIRPSFGLVWHYGINSWSTRPGGDWPISCATRYQGRVWVGSHDDATAANAGVHLLTRGASMRFGRLRTSQYVTGAWGGEARTLVQYLVLHAIGMGAATVQVHYRADRKGAWVSQTDNARRLEHAEEERDLWAVALWGTGTWGDHEPVAISIPLDRNNAFVHQWRFQGSARLRLIAFEPHVDPASAPVILPLQGKR